MNRRQFLLGTVTTATLASTGALVWVANGTDKSLLTIEQALLKLEMLMQSQVNMTGQWDLSQVLNHCAQSVEFSMLGFPQHKPEWFKNSLGQLAFSAFSEKGEMRHSLSEPIPGAAILKPDTDLAAAYHRFKYAMLDFQQYSGEFAEHFAFGRLTKPEYEQAHVMHFYNHMQEMVWQQKKP